MLERDKEYDKLKEKLANGDYDSNDIQLYNWLKNYKWGALQELAKGCLKNKDSETLHMLYACVKTMMEHPNAESLHDRKDLIKCIMEANLYPSHLEDRSRQELVEHFNTRIVEICTLIMREIILAATSINDDKCKQILLDLSNSDNLECQLYCCANIENPVIFLNHQNERVKHLAQLRINAIERWKSLDAEDKKSFRFLSSALNYHAIVCWNGGNAQPTYSFTSLFFESEGTPYFVLEQDLFKEQDNKILVSLLYDLIAKGEIKLKPEIESHYFKNKQKKK